MHGGLSALLGVLRPKIEFHPRAQDVQGQAGTGSRTPRGAARHNLSIFAGTVYDAALES